mgnify:CR=1 FL=1
MNSDPISDFLTRIRNASMVNKPSVSVPHSKFKLELSKLLKEEGYVTDVKVSGEGSKKQIEIDLKYSDNGCLLYTSPSPRDVEESRMPSSA